MLSCCRCGDRQDETTRITAAQRFAQVNGKGDERLVPYSRVTNPEQHVLHATRPRSPHESPRSSSMTRKWFSRLEFGEKPTSFIPAESLTVYLVRFTANGPCGIFIPRLFRVSSELYIIHDGSCTFSNLWNGSAASQRRLIFFASYPHSTIALQIPTHRSELRDRISEASHHGNNEKFLGLSRTLTLAMYR